MFKIKFGYTNFGKHILVKLRVLLTPEQKKRLEATFPELIFSKNKKVNYRNIQGCITKNTFPLFLQILKACLLKTKILKLQNELKETENPFPFFETTAP